MDDVTELSLEEIAGNIGRKMSDETPADDGDKPAAKEIQPKAEAEVPQEVEAKTGEEAEAPADEVAIDKPEPDKVPAQIPATQQAAPKEDPEAKLARDQLQSAVTYAKAFLGQIHAQIMGEFSDIKSIDDLNRVGEIDPGRYNRYVMAQTKMQNVVTQYQQLEKQAADARANEGPKIDWAAEKARLDKEVPDLADPVKGPALERQLLEYAKEKGISPAGKTAVEIATLYESMQFRNEQKAKAAQLAEANKKAAKAPPVQQPGTPRNLANAKDERAKEQSARFAKSGSINDLAELLSLKM